VVLHGCILFGDCLLQMLVGEYSTYTEYFLIQTHPANAQEISGFMLNMESFSLVATLSSYFSAFQNAIRISETFIEFKTLLMSSKSLLLQVLYT